MGISSPASMGASPLPATEFPLVGGADGVGPVVGGVVGAMVGLGMSAALVACLLMKRRRRVRTLPRRGSDRALGSSRRTSKKSVHAEPLPPLPTPPSGEYGMLPKMGEYQDGAYLEMKALAANADGGYGGAMT